MKALTTATQALLCCPVERERICISFFFLACRHLPPFGRISILGLTGLELHWLQLNYDWFKDCYAFGDPPNSV